MEEKIYRITMTESQLRIMIKAIEDWSRFLSGQCEMWNAISLLDNYHEIKEKLEQLQNLVAPDLPSGASYGWSGGGCENEKQAKAIAMSYMLYREPLHYLSIHSNKNHWSVYDGNTLTCPEQGPMIKIEEIK
jgi:hypothetical protein